MARNSETEPVWSKYITEDNLPTEENLLRVRKSLNNRFRLVPQKSSVIVPFSGKKIFFTELVLLF